MSDGLYNFAASALQAATGMYQSSVASDIDQDTKNFIRDTNEINHEWALEQNRWNDEKAKEYFNMENEYNSPANQRKLLQEAGYNPALLNGELSQASATVPQSANLATSAAIDPHSASALQGFNQGLSTIANAGVQYLQNKYIQAQTDKVTEEIPQIKEMTKKIMAETHCTEEQAKTYAVQIDKANQDILQSKQNIEYLKKQGGYIDFKKNIESKQLDIQSKLCENTIKETLSRIGLNNAQISKISEEIVKIGFDCVLEGREIEALNLKNEYQKIINMYAPDLQQKELDKIDASIYGSCTSSVTRTISSLSYDLGNALKSIFSSNPKPQINWYLQDRINSKGGFLNQD